MIGIWGTGVIGKSLAALLTREAVPFRILNRQGDVPASLTGGSPITASRLTMNSDKSEMLNALRGLSVLVHCAGRANNSDAEFKKAAYVLSDSAAVAGLRRVVLLSTVAVYGDAISSDWWVTGKQVNKNIQPMPDTPYGRSRYDVERYLREELNHRGLEFTVVRVPMVLGAGMNAQLFHRLRPWLDGGIFPLCGSPSARLPCIQSERLARCLAILARKSGPLKDLYQFSQSMLWTSVLHSYEQMTGRSIRSFRLPGYSLYCVLEFLGAHRLGSIVRILSSEVTYLDDLEFLLNPVESREQIAVSLVPNAALSKILWQ